MGLDSYDEEVKKAASQLLVELAFLFPPGTKVSQHPISDKLVAYKKAIEARAKYDARQERPSITIDIRS